MGARRRLTAGTVTLLSTSSMLAALRPRYNMPLQCPRLPRGLVREKGAVVLTCRSLTWTPLETSQLGQRRVLNKRSGHLCRNIQGLNFRRNLNKAREVLKEKAMSGFPGIDLPGLKCSLLGETIPSTTCQPRFVSEGNATLVNTDNAFFIASFSTF